MRTRKKTINPAKKSAPTKKVAPVDKSKKVRVVDNPGDISKIKDITVDSHELDKQDGKDVGSETEYKSILLGLKLKNEEQQAEIERLKKDNSGGVSKEELEGIEAAVEAKLSRRLDAGFQAAEDRQNFCLSIFSQKIDRAFKDGEFRFQGDRRFYKVLEEVKDSLEESYFHLMKDLPSDSKAWEPFNEVVAKIQDAEDNLITAQVSRHGWKLIDEYTDEEVFLQVPLSEVWEIAARV